MRIYFLIPAILALLTAPALAGFEVCNKTDTKMNIAIGYDDDGTWTSEGWWVAEASECVEVISGDLTERYYYILVDSYDEEAVYDHRDRVFNFCVMDESFTIRGDEDCEARGYETRDFNEVDTGDSASYGIDLNP